MKTTSTLMLAAILSCGATAHAEPIFVPIDGSNPRFAAKDFGYEIKLVATGARLYVTVELDAEAAKSFKIAALGLYQGDNLLVDTRLGLDRDAKTKASILVLALDPRTITGGEVTIHSDPIKGRPLVTNFGGFSISVKTLLEKAYAADTLEKIRTAAPLPQKTDSTAQLLKHLEDKGPLIRAAAIGLLGARKAKEAIPKLIELVGDVTALPGSDNWVGRHAALALAEITGRPASFEQKDWQAWWHEVKETSGAGAVKAEKGVTVVAKLQKVSVSPTRARYLIATFKVVEGKAKDFVISQRYGKVTEKQKMLWKAIMDANGGYDLPAPKKDLIISIQVDEAGRPDLETWRVVEGLGKKEK